MYPESIRRAMQTDAPELRNFVCADQNAKWTREPQRLIRGEVAEMVAGGFDGRTHVFVATVDIEIVGVVVCRWKGDVLTIPALGVTHQWRRRGIGLRLKGRVLIDVGPVTTSQVHRRNHAMNGLNSKLACESTEDPDDGEYLLTVVDLTKCSHLIA